MTGPTEPNQGSPTPPEPPWRPPPSRDRNSSSIDVGLVLLAIGVWFLLDQTLGFEMPRVRWGDLWPIFLIGLGGIMLYRSVTRGPDDRRG